MAPCAGDLGPLVLFNGNKADEKKAEKQGFAVAKSVERKNLTLSRAWKIYQRLFYRGVKIWQAKTLAFICGVGASNAYCCPCPGCCNADVRMPGVSATVTLSQ